jgi:alanine transaminase
MYLSLDNDEFAATTSIPIDLQSNTVVYTKRLTEATMNPKLRRMDYAVRGKVVIAADRINAELSDPTQRSSSSSSSSRKDYPFEHIVYTNIGNPHSVGQLPLTWPRQVLALADLPDALGVDHPDAPRLFPADAIRRAREIKDGLGGGGTGAYSHSQGAKMFRDDICQFLLDRDKIPSCPDDIFMTNGASSAIEMVLTCLIANSQW